MLTMVYKLMCNEYLSIPIMIARVDLHLLAVMAKKFRLLQHQLSFGHHILDVMSIFATQSCALAWSPHEDVPQGN